jgi:hypothetical protein
VSPVSVWGILLVGDEGVSRLNQFVRDVSVEVERDRDGDVRADPFADRRDQRPFAVVHPLGHHRAVETENHAVEVVTVLLDAVEDLLGVELVGVLGDDAARRRGGGDGVAQVDTLRFSHVDGPALAGVGAAHLFGNLVAEVLAALLEQGSARRPARERVGLVGESTEKYSFVCHGPTFHSNSVKRGP